MQKPISKSKAKQRGFTLLLAALVASVALTVGAAIYSLTVKQIRLSSLGRDSALAWYTADTGAECALYWDSKYDYFGITAPTDPDANNPSCNGEDLNASGRAGTYPQTMEFEIDMSGRCVEVVVFKDINSSGIVTTNTQADGYSVPCAERATNARALQRTQSWDR